MWFRLWLAILWLSRLPSYLSFFSSSPEDTFIGFREGGRERERARARERPTHTHTHTHTHLYERETLTGCLSYVLRSLACTPTGDWTRSPPWLAREQTRKPSVCPEWESNQWPLALLDSAQLCHTGQGPSYISWWWYVDDSSIFIIYN